MIKWLVDGFFPQEDEKKPCSVDNTKYGGKRRPALWPTQGISYLLDKLKTLFLEIMISVERDDPRYLKLSHWLELVDMIKDSIEHHGLKSKIEKNLGLEVKEESNEDSNQQS